MLHQYQRVRERNAGNLHIMMRHHYDSVPQSLWAIPGCEHARRVGDGAIMPMSFAVSFRIGILIAWLFSVVAHGYSVLTRQVDKIADICGGVSAQSATMFPISNEH